MDFNELKNILQIEDTYQYIKEKISSFKDDLLKIRDKIVSIFHIFSHPPSSPTSLETNHVVTPQPIPCTKEIGQQYAQEALNLIQELKKLGASPGSTVQYNGKTYTMPTKNQYGRTTWSLEVKGRKFEINEFEKDAYNGPTQEDFIKRAELTYLACREYATTKLEDPIKDKILQQLNEFYETCIENTKDWTKMDWKEIQKGNESTALHYTMLNARATERFAQMARDMQSLIDLALPESSHFSIDDLDRAEREYVLERDRPIILNIFPVDSQPFIHMHIPEAKTFTSLKDIVPQKTIPSTLRERKGLANYLTSYGGFLDSEGKVQITYEGTRHASYSPIALSDSFARKQIAAQNVKQILTDLTHKRLAPDYQPNTRDNPLIIPLRSMLLMTPKRGDSLRNRTLGLAGDWIGESEVKQLEESVLALRLYHGRPIPIQFGGDTVWIKPDISIMNLGTNAEAGGIGLLGKIPTHPYQAELNARGFIEFMNDVEQRLLDTTKEKGFVHEQLKELLLWDKQDPAYASCLRQQTQEKAAIEQTLNTLYGQLDSLYNVPQSLDVKLKIRLLLTQIKSHEKALCLVHKNLLDVMQASYLTHQSTHQEKLKGYLNFLNQTISNPSFKEHAEELLLLKQLVDNLFEAKALFYKTVYKTPESILEFQAIYIQTHSMLTNPVEFFCKSGEDRTGRMDDKVMEREIFRHRPHLETNLETRRKVTQIVHQFSVSQNTTEQNSNARGEQISYVLNPEFRADLETQQATLAKRVIQKAKKLKASPKVELAWKNIKQFKA